MSRCKKLEKVLKSGRFDEHLHDISNQMQIHLSECSTCKQLYDDLVQIENMILETEPAELSSPAKTRIRMNVTQAVAGRKPQFIQVLKPALGLAFAAMIVFFLILQPHSKQPIPEMVSQTQIAGDDLQADILDLMNIDIFLFDDADLETAVILQSDNTLISDALETLSASMSYIYDEMVYTALSDLDEKEWDLIRRYLM